MKLDIIKQTRQIAADSLYVVLKKLLASDEPISEVNLRDAWLKEMQKNKTIFAEGWYQPPPYGMIVLFGTESEVSRVSYLSARPKERWPRNDILLDRQKGIAYLYASPVDKKTGVIGDFGITLYFGTRKMIKDLLIHCLEADKKIFEASHIGMELGEVADISRAVLQGYGLQNDSLAITDKGENVIGHTIPHGFAKWTEEEKSIVKKNTWKEVKDIISKKRVNVKDNETFIIENNSAITIEPRPKSLTRTELPKSLSYHTIALFPKGGSKELITGFDELFKLVGMDYML